MALFDSPEGIQATQLIENLLYEDRVNSLGFLSATEAFGTQAAGMAYGWNWVAGWLQGNYPDFDYWHMFALPTPDGDFLPAYSINNMGAGFIVFEIIS